MRRSLLALLLLFISAYQPLFAQQDSLLKNFKYRIDHYRAITIDLVGAGQHINTQNFTGSYRSGSQSFSFGGSIYQVKSTDRLLSIANGSISTGLGHGEGKNPTDYFTNTNFTLNENATLVNKWFSRKQRFVEFGIATSASINSGNSTNKIMPSKIENDIGYQALAFTIGAGKGRLENITDMQNALWLAQALQQEGKLSRPLSATELNGLGRAITAANNTRVLDARKRTQFILETIDAYLQSNNLISSTDIRYFSSLNDIAFFAFNEPRLSGKEVFVRIKPGINHYNEQVSQKPADTKDKTNSFTFTGRVEAGINKHLPINLKHQQNFGIAAILNYAKQDYNQKYYANGSLTSSLTYKPEIKQAGAFAFFEHAIYPNTRTIIKIKLDAEGGYQEVDSQTSGYGRGSLAGQLNYFISYRARFNTTVGVLYQKNVYQVGNQLNQLPESFQLVANAGLQFNL